MFLRFSGRAGKSGEEGKREHHALDSGIPGCSVALQVFFLRYTKREAAYLVMERARANT